MALIQAQFVSESLMRSVPIEVVLPVDKLAFPGTPKPEYKPFKTLYLLHGVFGSCVDWVHGTRVQRWAEAHDLAVVMPSGENGFYVDNHPAYNHYSQFVGEELVEVTRRMFHLSERREDTFIGGLSMGGYGALENGLKYHGTFGAICAFSPAVLFEPGFGLERMPMEGIPGFGKAHLINAFGDLDAAAQSDLNPRVLAKGLVDARAAGEEVNIPDVYISCGTEDELIVAGARTMSDYFDEIGLDHTYEEWPGAHEWDFWDESIHRVIEGWLPVNGTSGGVNSGNVTGE